MRWMIASFLAVAGVAHAADDIKLAPGEVYKHKPSGLSVAATLGDLARTRAQAFSPEQLDEFVEFASADGNEDITVFVYRLVLADMPVWFDRTRWTIEHRNDLYGDLSPLDRPVPFIPPSQANASGLQRIYLGGKGPFRSTAVAMMPMGDEWIVNVRYSSGTYSAEAIGPRLAAVLAEIAWPKKIGAHPDAAEVTECAAPLKFKGAAKEVRPQGAELLMEGMASSLAKEATKNGASKPVIWCRDSATLTPSKTTALYRADGAADGYVIAFSDAGRGLSVGSDNIAQLNSRGPLRWSVSLAEMDKVTHFLPYDRMPTPAQAVASFERGRYSSIATTWGKSEITVNSDLMK
jgi:hypothetical protein